MNEDMKLIEWKVSEGAGYLTLKRPPLNVLNIAMLREIESALKALSLEDTLRVLLLRAEGKFFSAGVDIADHTREKVDEMIPLFNRVCVLLATFPAPTLAAVQAPALGGGCELALCCDLVVASKDASFGQPEIKLASFPPIAAVRLPSLVGYHHAAELLFTGDSVSATEAARIGLINRAVPKEEFELSVRELVGKMCSLSASALRICKEALRTATDHWLALADMEKLYLDELMSTEDAQEGLAAFLLKRAPAWKHK